MPRLWGICLLLASVQALPTNHLNKSCRHSGDDPMEESPCSRDINLQHIQRMESYMRPEINACHDFHGYACGNWRSVHGAGVSAMSLSDSHINQRYVDLFERLLKDPRAPEHRLPMFSKLLRYYQSCQAVDKPRLRRYLDHLPIPATNHWLELVAILGRYGCHEHFVKLGVMQHNSTQHMVTIQPHEFNLSLNLSPTIYGALKRYMDGILPPLSQLRIQFKQLEETLTRLFKPKNVNRDDEAFITYTLEQVQRELPAVNWTYALELRFNATFDGNHQVQSDDLPTLGKVIEYFNQADARLLQLYSLSRFLQHVIQLPHHPLNSLSGCNSSSSASSSSSSNSNANATANLAVTCVQHMRKTLYLAMNYVYEHIFYSKQRAADERVIFGVFEELKSQFSQKLRQNEFGLDAVLLEALQQKVQVMRINIGNMPLNATDQFYVDCERHWQVGGDFYLNHLESLLHYYAHLTELERTENATMRQLYYSFNHHGPAMQDNIDATPYFFCLSNVIIMPYAYVQLPLYHAQFWPALLYGDLGNTLGHEMLHAFDPEFVEYDAHGVVQDYGEQLKLNSHYMAGVNCLNDSDVIMLTERAADISGTRLALQTYMPQPSVRRHDGRLYFLQFAQFFCGEEADIFHDTGSKRLNYALAQMPEFAEVFHCDQGTPMNPVNRCKFW